MMRRRGMPLMRTAATTAVVVGTAGAVKGHQEAKQEQKAAAQQAQQQQAAAEQQAQIDAAVQQQLAAQQAAQQPAAQQPAAPAAPPPAAPAAAAPGNDLMAQLNQLAQMKQAGILTDEEFAAAKAKLLAGG